MIRVFLCYIQALRWQKVFPNINTTINTILKYLFNLLKGQHMGVKNNASFRDMARITICPTHL